MPLVRISTTKDNIAAWSQGHMKRLRGVLVTTLQAPDNAYLILVETAHERLLPAASIADHTLFEITLIPGRTEDAKQQACDAIRAICAEIGLAENSVFVVFIETERQNWFFPTR